jgi:uncharacterized protein involved in exopolysaccharide biosynthesis
MTFHEITPLEQFSLLVRRWWLIALLTVLGSCLGWGFHILRPPLYEAVATFSVVINFPETAPLNELQQDQAIGLFKAQLTATDVVEKVRPFVAARGLSPEALVLNQRVFTERRQSQIDLIVRHEDPAVAAEIANLWAETAEIVVTEAYTHALQAHTLWQYQNSLQQCLQLPPAAGNLCTYGNLDALEARLQAIDSKRQSELLASRGLLPTLIFGFSQRADVPQKPEVYRASAFLLGGALLGGVLGVVFALLPVRTRKQPSENG